MKWKSRMRFIAARPTMPTLMAIPSGPVSWSSGICMPKNRIPIDTKYRSMSPIVALTTILMKRGDALMSPVR
jgi:hypothetical protein